MKGYKKTILALLALVAAITTFATLRSQSQSVPQAQHGSAEDHVPVVDYHAAASTEPERKAQSARYHGEQRLASVEELPLGIVNDHWFRFLTALPVSRSDEIVIGQIKGAQAYLSEDKTTVYSEYQVSIDEVLKSSGMEAFGAGSTLVVEREGGAVRFASGRTRQLRVIGQGIPRIGGRYVLFLKRGSEGQGYRIVTGYELRAGQVFPLDSTSIPQIGNGVKLPFDAYAGTDEDTFLNKLRSAIADPAQAASEGR